MPPFFSVCTFFTQKISTNRLLPPLPFKKNKKATFVDCNNFGTFFREILKNQFRSHLQKNIGREKYELFKRQFKIDKDNLKAKPLTYRDCQLF